jgi:hypothetical protein
MKAPSRKKKSLKAPNPTRPHMPGYGLPKGTKGLLPWSWAEERLTKSHNYWISTCTPDGSPHTMIVWGLWLDGNFYFSTGQKSRKARNLAVNPNCVICSERSHEAVILEGTASLLTDSTIRKRFATAYERKYKWDMSNFSEPVYVVRARVAFGLYEKDFIGKATRWKFRV